MRKKLFLIVAILFTALSASAVEEGEKYMYGGNLYQFHQNYYTKEYYAELITNNNTGDVVIPTYVRYFYQNDTYRDYNVEYIHSYAFKNCTDVTSVRIPKYVTHIDNAAFDGCTNLRTVIFADECELNWVMNYAFRNCTSLESIQLPDEVIWIENGAFLNCSSLQSVTMGDKVTRIYYDAFKGCTNLSSVRLSNALTEINQKAFEGCASLSTLTFPASYTEVADSTFAYCTGLRTLTFPSTLTKIGKGAFKDCTGLQSISFSDSFTTMDDNAFEGCTSLTNIDFGNSLKYIGTRAFMGCTGLKTLNISNSIVQIYYQAFYGCTGLQTVNFGNSLSNIGNESFRYCTSLQELNFPASLTYVQPNAFMNCTGLISVDFGTARAEIGTRAFAYTHNLERLRLGNVTKIGDFAFYESNLYELLTLPNSLTEIGIMAFSYCSSLNAIKIAKEAKLTKIGEKAFFKSVQLKQITLPPSLKEVGLNAFLDAGILTVSIYDVGAWCDIDFKCDVPLGQYSFSDCYSNPLNSHADILLIDGESCRLVTDLVIPPTVTKIRPYAFINCTGLTSVTFPETITEIGANAFFNCTNLAGQLTLPQSVTLIGIGAFRFCSKLTGELTIPDKVTKIDNYAFEKCSGFNAVSIGKSVEEIASATFLDASNLRTIYNYSNLNITKWSEDYGYVAYYAWNVYNNLYGRNGDYVYEKNGDDVSLKFYFGSEPDITIYPTFSGKRVKGISDNCFKDNTSLQSIKLPVSLKTIGNNAFESCTSLASIIIPTYVNSVGEYAFKDCTGLTSLEICEGVRTLNTGAFYGCSALTELVIPNTITSLGSLSFYNATSLQSVKFGTGITEIPNHCFQNCSALTKLVFPSNVTTICSEAFSGCTGLKTLEIGSNIQNIYSFAFDLIDFDYVTVAATNSPFISGGTFSVTAGTPLYVPKNCVGNYQFVGRTQPWIEAGFDIQEMVDITNVDVSWKDAPAGAPMLRVADPEATETTLQFTATFEPANASLPYIFWRSTNPDVATVDANGKVVIKSTVLNPTINKAPSRVAIDSECKIIAETMYADQSLAVEITIKGDDINIETIGNTGYQTLYYSDRALLVPDGISGWVFVYDSGIKAQEAYPSNSVIPAGEAVVLYTDTPGEYVFKVSSTGETPIAGNCLHGTDTEQEVTVSGIPYILANGSNGIGFYQAASEGGKTFTNGAHKAYLEIPASKQAPERIILDFDNNDVPTGISCIISTEADHDRMYNILGQPVGKDYKGFVIKNGRKVINK